jgi:8-amino-7-oxononanoate synthase
MTRLPITSSRATAVDIGGRELLYFGGCDYLALAHDRRVVQALAEGAVKHGVSSGAARETSGNAVPHDELEADLARRIGTAAAVIAPDGFTANCAALQALAEDHDEALIDEAAHPSLFAAARAAPIDLTVFPHLDVGTVAAQLRSRRRAVVISDSVFPLRGEIAPIAALIEATRAAGATLLIDDAHGTGVVGTTGRGALEHGGADALGEGRSEHVVLTSTLSKSLGAYGGFVAGSERIVERVRLADAYLTTTPIPPAVAAASLVALELAFGSDELVRRLRANAACLRAGFERVGLPIPRDELPVFPFTLSPPERMHALHEKLLESGILAPLVRYPGGAPSGRSDPHQFRVAVNAAHRIDDIERLVDALAAQLGAGA